MNKPVDSIYVVTTLNTKSFEAQYVKQLIERHGAKACIVDLTTLLLYLDPVAEVSAAQVARHHPEGESAVFCGDRGKAIATMSLAFERFMNNRQDVAAILGLGGSWGTALITPAMQALPIGIPKLMVSTMVSGNVSGYSGASDIAMMNSVTDISGLNRISRQVLKNAANQITGAVILARHQTETYQDKPAIGLTMFGVTPPVYHISPRNLKNV